MSETESKAPEGDAPESEASSQPEQEFPLPPPTLEFLVVSLKMQAEMHLGLFPLGEGEGEEKPKPNARLARHSIDMLGMLNEKTKGNLTLEEQRFLENTLTELRFRYVQVSEDSRKS